MLRAIAVGALLLLAACAAPQDEQAPHGFAFAAPAELDLLADLELNAPVAATVTHGERLEIMGTRRRFVLVRTAAGAEGWTDSSNLLTRSEMEDLEWLAQSAAARPSQGSAHAFDALNVHIRPDRSAPSFLQLKPDDTVEVIAHRVTSRGSSQRTVPKSLPEPEPPATLEEVAEPADEEVPIPAPPTPPLPDNWQQLSRPRLTDLIGGAAGRRRGPADDWFLVRTPDGQTGWALMRMMFMGIPDEVGQYAEGNYITSYHRLNQVEDRTVGQMKQNWLWTTSSRSLQPYDFDSFRVFYFNRQRHRYETAYIERNLRGHYPVETFLLEGHDGTAFSLVLEDRNGELRKRTYVFDGVRAHRISEEPYQAPAPLPDVQASETFDVGPPPEETEGWTARLRGLGQRWFGP